LPALVVVDTVNRSLVGSESNDEDMAKYIKAADAIRESFDCLAALVHHCGVEGSRPRGHTSLTGAADAQLGVRRDDAKNVVVTLEYMKDGPEGETIVSRLEQVEVGEDEDGDAITSCIVEAVEGAAAEQARTAVPKLTKGARIALDALHQAVDELGQSAPASNHVPPHVRTVTLSQWRDRAYRVGISASEDLKAKQVAFRRASEALVAAKQIGIWEPHVWTVKPSG
jgi:hypothetical protein